MGKVVMTAWRLTNRSDGERGDVHNGSRAWALQGGDSEVGPG